MIIFLRILLLPFSAVYFLIVFFRNLFYNRNILNSYSVNKSVISIGNITTGGTGKSPFTIFLAEHFINKGLKPAIISRGYKRESDNIEIVFDGEKITGVISKCGDEPMMMANDLSLNYKNFYILTGSDRVKTAEFAIMKFNPDIIILDDAFQHRKIKRNLDIVLIDAEDYTDNRFYNSAILPAGNLRENFGNLKRAGILIQNNKFSELNKLHDLDKFSKDCFILKYKVKGFYKFDNIKYDIEGKNVISFAGIANPDSFFKMIDSGKCKSVKKIGFKDHHNYSKSDIEKLTANSNPDDIFVTTEKDFVKVKEYEDFLKYFNVLFMKIELNLNNEERFFSIVDNLTGLEI